MNWSLAALIETDEKYGEFTGTGDAFGGWPTPQPKTERIIVDKRTHRIRFEDESESQVTVVIEPKQ